MLLLSASPPALYAAMNYINDFKWVDAPLSGWQWPLGAVALYLAVIYSIQWHVEKNRKGKPYAVQTLFAYHNLFMSAFSLVMFVGTLYVFCSRSLRERSLRFAFCEESNSTFTSNGSARGAYYFAAYVYYLSKYYELLDTVFLALKGKLVGWGGLNVYHHSLVVFMAWLWLECAQSLQHIGILANTAVHVLMYFYFFLQSMGQRPRWKPLVTQCQIVQFAFSFLCLGANLWAHFRSAHTAPTGCQGQQALLFNSVFNCTLLLEFVSIFGRNKKKDTNAAPHLVQAKAAGQDTAAVAPLLTPPPSTAAAEQNHADNTLQKRKIAQSSQ